MSIYGTGAEAYRDTTKWLVAFVPSAALVGAAALIGPRLVGNGTEADGTFDWLGDNAVALGGLTAVVAGMVLIVLLGAKVLSAQPKNFTALFTTDQAALSQAFSAGVGAPHFLDDTTFKNAIATLNADWMEKKGVADADVARATATTDRLREWAFEREMAAAFKRFAYAFAAASVLIVGGFVVASVALRPLAGAIKEPKAVRVEVEPAGAKHLLAATGCTDAAATKFLAVAGTWDAPILAVDGPGCRFGAEWRVRASTAEIRIP